MCVCVCVPYPHYIPSNQPTNHFLPMHTAKMLPISLEVDLALAGHC